jgi:hypothetical protein
MAEGKARIGERVNMQLHLRFILQQPFTEFNDVMKLEKLISRGKVLGGSVLLMDVVLAEKHLLKLKVFLRDIAIIQRVCRGYMCRKRLQRQRTLNFNRINYLRKVKLQSKELARVFVAEVMDHCVHSHSTETMRPLLRIAAHMSDMYVIASVHLKARGTRKHIGLPCPLCTRTNKKELKPVESSTDLEMIATNTPLVCICRMVMMEEQWVVRAYDPLSGATHTKDLDITEVQQTIIDISAAHAFLDPLYKLKALFALNGSLHCDPLGPLFDRSTADLYCTNGDLNPSPSLAEINSSKESAVLFSLPKNLSNTLLSAARSTNNYFKEIDLLEGLRCRGSQSPLVVSNILDLSTITVSKKAWEPLTDYYEAIRLKAWAAYFMLALETMYSNTILALSNCKILVLRLHESVQWANMIVEDCLANLCRTELLLAEATAKVQRAMQLSHNNLEEVTMQERGLQENWKNAWSSLEDGNEWIGLNHRRKYLRVLNIQETEYQTSVVNFAEESKKLKNAIALVVRLQDDVSKNREWVKTFRPNVDLAAVVSGKIKILTDELVKAVMKTFSLPYKRIMEVSSTSSNMVTGRRLQRVPFDAVFARDQYVRTRHAYRSAWKSFGSLPLAPRASNLLPDPCKPDVTRCVVEIFYDPLTTNYLLRVSEECLIEEAVQHKDLGLPYEAFTNVTPTYPNELLLNKGDMDTLFATSPEWPRYLQFNQVVPQTKANRKALNFDSTVPVTILDERPKTSDSQDSQEPLKPSRLSQQNSQKQDKHTSHPSTSLSDKPASRSRMRSRQNLPPANPSPSHSLSPERIPELGVSQNSSLDSYQVGVSQNSSSDSFQGPQNTNLAQNKLRKKSLKSSSSDSVTSMNQTSITRSLRRSSTAPSPVPYPAPSPGKRSKPRSTPVSRLKSRKKRPAKTDSDNSDTEGHLKSADILQTRPLDGSKVWILKKDKFNDLPITYRARRFAVEEVERNRALLLFTYMRLQPHTGRVCLGLFHLQRRTTHLTGKMENCCWHEDAMKARIVFIYI